ncbi:MAG: ABC transporter ATP-binding protein [Candidatus Hydrogenedentota bacterium]|nr:MAG: ABC transporter ATP-binding protein [Candidatus Hydrogenedentota bacterium]
MNKPVDSHPPYHHGFGITRLKRTIHLGFKSIYSHGLRSLLTVMGMVFGVSSVIAMLAVGEGASFEAQEQLRQLGSNNIIIKSVKPAEAEESSGFRGRMPSLEYGLTYQDIETIQRSIPGITRVVPGRVIRSNVWHLSRKVNSDVMGTSTIYPEIRNFGVYRGRFFSEAEQEARENVCVLSYEMAKELFPVSDPLGKSVKISGDYYKIVGIMEPGGYSNVGQSEAGSNNSSPNRLYIPITAAKYRFGEKLIRQSSSGIESETIELHEATIQVAHQESVIEIGEIVRQILERRHKKKDFEVEVPLALLRQAEASARMFNIVLGAIAGISLLVGGIGIMNIMLASVTERTREIGIRRALGAKKSDIIMQFLVETVILSGAGGLIGVVLGMTVPFFITYFSDMQTIVTFWAPILAFSISGLVGIIFGIYPAMRAAEMDPVEALRHE